MKTRPILAVIMIFCSTSLLFAFLYAETIKEKNHLVDKIHIQSQKEENKDKQLVQMQTIALLSPSESNYLVVAEAAKERGYDRIASYYYRRVRSNEGLYNYGSFLFNSKDYQGAIDVLGKIDNKSVEIVKLLEKSFLFEGNYKEVNRLCNNYKQYDDLDDTCDLAYLVSRETTSLYEAKSDKLNNIIGIKNSNSQVVALYLYIYSQINPQAAQVLLSGSQSSFQRTRDGNIVLGKESYKKQKYDEAIRYLTKAKEMDPYYPQVYKHLIEIYRVIGDQNEVNRYQSILGGLAWD